MPKSLPFKSPLHQMTQTTPTCLWNDSAAEAELAYAIEHGAVGATCNPVIAVEVVKKEMAFWAPRIRAMAAERPTATEGQIAWQVIEDMSAMRAGMLRPIFEAQHGRNGRLSIQTDPRLFRDGPAILEGVGRRAGPNMTVKIAATSAGIWAIEEATARGISINATVSFSVPRRWPGRGRRARPSRRERDGEDVSRMESVCMIMVSPDDWLEGRRREVVITPIRAPNGPGSRRSRRPTRSIAPAATGCGCCPRRFATTCTGASSSAATP
jgi:transaldolase